MVLERKFVTAVNQYLSNVNLFVFVLELKPYSEEQ